MDQFFEFLNEPAVTWALMLGASALVLIDYLFPVDWPAYVGYILFAVFIGLIAPVSQVTSLLVMGASAIILLILHEYFFARFLTNAPKYERIADDADNRMTVEPNASQQTGSSQSADSSHDESSTQGANSTQSANSTQDTEEDG